jgi:chemotaxis protein methyltransferase CheR
VFCKNVAIYFRAEATRKLIEGLRDTLTPGGYLLMGHAESLWHMSDLFSLVEHDRTFCYRKTAPKPVDPSAQYDSCLAAFRGGDWDAAESALGALVASCPTFAPALLLLGGLYAHRGRFDDAMRQAQAVLRVSDLEPRAHLLVGMIAERRRRPTKRCNRCVARSTWTIRSHSGTSGSAICIASVAMLHARVRSMKMSCATGNAIHYSLRRSSHLI